MTIPTCARIVGGPGSGKTTRLLEIIDKTIGRLGIDPMQVGFVSFTRAARREAATRAGEKFNIPPQQLEKEGWFRTLHSVAYRMLGVAKGELISGSAEDNHWLKNALNDPTIRITNKDENDDAMLLPSDQSDSGKALSMWDAARNRLVPLETMWEQSSQSDARTPDLDDCRSAVSMYEQAKKNDGRLDFCDLLMLFAGKQWTGNHASPFEDVEPGGEAPHLPVWIHDEMQDCSFLTSLVFTRMIRSSTWVYLAGDRNQEIYSWAGANGDIFAKWDCAKEDFLPVSHRCDRNILDLGKKIIKDDRLKDFHPTKEGGEVIREDIDTALGRVQVGQDTLILARTNDYAKRIAMALDDAGTPWKPTKGNSTWTAPARAAGIEACITLKKGGGIDGEQVHRLMELFPVKSDGTVFFEHGSKAHYADKETRATSHKTVPLTLSDLGDAGCTDAFKELLSSGRYVELLERPAAKMATAAMRHGIDAVRNPKILVGTCHSAKGAEAEHVILLNSLPFPTQRAIETEEGLAAERRVWYVSATRAKHKLTICEDGGQTFDEL